MFHIISFVPHYVTEIEGNFAFYKRSNGGSYSTHNYRYQEKLSNTKVAYIKSLHLSFCYTEKYAKLTEENAHKEK